MINGWILTWDQLDEGSMYLVCAVNVGLTGKPYLGRPTGILPGWEVRQLMERWYAALPIPPLELDTFPGIEVTP